MSACRIFVADGDNIARLGVCVILEAYPEWTGCGETENGYQAVDQVKLVKPDLVILSMYLQNLTGLAAMRQIRAHNPSQRILIFTSDTTDYVVRECLSAGARGFVWKSDPARDIPDAVRAIQQGGTFFTSRVEQMILRGYLNKNRFPSDVSNGTMLTPREVEVTQLIGCGRTSAEVASLLSISGKTVETHRANVMQKLGVHSTAELVLYAVRNNIVQIPRAAV